MKALVLYIRLHDGRYHGCADWPPSPARLFQALVAGAGLGGPLAETEKNALEWLERQDPPLVAAPLARQPSRGVLFYMPNNDSDAIGGDPQRMAKIRTATKHFKPWHFDAAVPFLYVWSLTEEADGEHAKVICSLAERLYQFGRGIDMAWAWGEVLDDGALKDLFAKHPGHLYRPSAGSSEIELLAPCLGSLKSLCLRYEAFGDRFRYVKEGESVCVVFRKPPTPRFRKTPYNNPPSRQLYELQSATGAFAPWPLTRTTALVAKLRDGAVGWLKKALPGITGDIDRVLVGRRPDGTNDIPPEHRVRIIPLPSIGHFHADQEIRRVLVEVPPTCPLRADVVARAFSGLDVFDQETGEILATLVKADDAGFLRHYALEDALEDNRLYRVWRTVTPAVLPVASRSWQIGRSRMRSQVKTGSERRVGLERAAAAVVQALRHAGVRTRVDAIRLQREPFTASGARTEAFASGTRFAEDRLWHVELTFKEKLAGPLLLGNGRFMGLGLMTPVY
ncbi:type I-G CRISPR-associated protein Csb2 [Rehaibacterium terrae]|jgi:CRISPR-associated protein Csb2|uniref:CRISPR-associated protein Csb2 n=1 Tax=Rehaibacterium terrae TaxID=1341696 RepID=A0A7W7Y1M8_9GAMM|nr:type I-U CRISPR-associated protein Csb2 [Rehaibacterium terrae]MBB5016452.1 CRISPR-associated protein Csb2 [Rehaibacterium terrae]